MNFLFEITEGLGIAWDAIRANKMRSVLTTLGIVIGIISVTLMGAAINGLNTAFRSSISGIGADVLYADKMDWMINSWEMWRAENKRPNVSRDQYRFIEKEMPMAQDIAPVVETGLAISYKSKDSTSVRVIGTTDEFMPIRGFALADGRFISPVEAQAGRAVCVLGTNVAGRLFANESPIGKTVRLGYRPVEVVGVIEKQGSFLGLPSLDDEVIIPLGQLLYGYEREPSYEIQIKVDELGHMDDAKEELRGLMRRIRHVAPGDPDDFAINQQDQIIKVFNSIAGTIGVVGLVITSLSLFVGGIGIMNIMFVSVAERTREIGVRKAIGAKSRTILLQFLIEAAVICLIGGLLGLGLTYSLTFAVARILPVNMSLGVAGLAILVSLVTGVISGFLPAWRAARMNPVDALRNE
jgi:putative ABC transport system permease protein